MPIIDVNGELIEFPDDMSNSDIEAVLQNQMLGGDSNASLAEQAFTHLRGEPQKSIPVGDVAAGLGQGFEDVVGGVLQTVADVVGAEQLSADIAAGQRAADLEMQQRGGAAQGARLASQIAPAFALPVASAPLKAVAGGGLLAALTPEDEILTQEQALIRRAKKAAGGAAVTGGFIGAGKVVGGLRELARGRDADKIIARRLTQFDLTDLKSQLKKGQISVLPDVAGDELTGLTRQVGKQTGGAKDIIAEFFEGRASDSVNRVTKQLSKRVSDVDAYFANLDDIAASRAQVSAPLYKQAYLEAAAIPANKMKNLYTDKQFITAYNKAKRSYGLADDVAPDSLEALDQVKKVLDDDIANAYRDNKGNLAKVLTNTKNKILKIGDEESPAYAKARKIFADFKSLENAQEQGLKFSRMRPEEIKRYVKTLSAGEKEAFLIGVRENLQKTASSTADGASAGKRIFGNTYKKNQIKAAIQDPKTYNALKKRLQEDINASETYFKVLRGSRTDINQAEAGQELLEAAAREGSQGIKNQILDSAIYWFKNRYAGLTDKNAKILAKKLTSKEAGIKTIDNIIKMQKDALQKRVLLDVRDDLPTLLGLVGAQQSTGDI